MTTNHTPTHPCHKTEEPCGFELAYMSACKRNDELVAALRNLLDSMDINAKRGGRHILKDMAAARAVLAKVTS